MTPAEKRRDLALTLAAKSLEHAFQTSWLTLAQAALQPRGPGLEELTLLGAALFIDYVRPARGEISSIHVPRRLPRRGETPRDSWEVLLTLVADLRPLQLERPPNEPVDFGMVRAAANGIDVSNW